MDDKYRILVSQLGEDRLKRNVDIAEHLHGGSRKIVDCFYIATSLRELVRSVQLAQELEIPLLVIGSGSKVSLSFEGFRGLLIKNRFDEIKIFGIKGKVSRNGIGIEEAFVEAGAGVSLDKLADFAGRQNLGGLEGLRGLPGTVGGSVLENIVLSNFVRQVKVIGQDGEVLTLDRLPDGKDEIIISVIFKLKARG